MVFLDKETLEALSSSRILTSMITPAVLISACGTLIFSTSARLGRIFDRVNVHEGGGGGGDRGEDIVPIERMEFLQEQVALARKRAILIQKSMATLYSATALFVASSLGYCCQRGFRQPRAGLDSDDDSAVRWHLPVRRFGAASLRKPLQSEVRYPQYRVHRVS